MRALFDTNILIDYLAGIEAAKSEIAQFKVKTISIITWMEVLVGVKEAEMLLIVKNFLNTFLLVPLDSDIAELAVEIRRTHRIKLPDAIIWATAEKTNSFLVTRNIKDFPKDLPLVRVPYDL